jgi:glyoxylase-like metal-dependent hydrolase (beta-lactamase superfamily II)
MKRRNCIGLTLAALGTFSIAWSGPAPSAAPAPQVVARGVWLVAGGIETNREPDGNSVVFDAPEGLIVVDTGRHVSHRDAIVSLARALDKKIVAIVNSHWHLDHVSGNPALREAYPGLRVYASGAIDGALRGFLAASAKETAAYLDDPQIPEETRDDIRADLLTIRNGEALKPDVVIAASGMKTLGGRALSINLAPHAATSGDVWLYDEKTRVAALGDLVTLPAPFLDTACPEGWQAALRQVAATPFRIAIPGHGTPMTRAQFKVYEAAFDEFIDCSKSTGPEAECAARWAHAVQPLLGQAPLAEEGAQRTAAYYVGMLRANGGRSKYCESPRDPG